MPDTANALTGHPAVRLDLSARVAEASLMLDLFETAGIRSFALTLLDEAGHKVAFRPRRPVERLRNELAGLLLTCYSKRLNIIVRPLAARALSVIQLDDLSPSHLDRVRCFSFLVLETSPGNFQAWLATNDTDAATIRRIKQGTGADLNASGATRLAGSYNFKPKYAPDYPCVRLQSIAPGCTVTVAELEQAGLVPPEEAIIHTSGACSYPSAQAAPSRLADLCTLSRGRTARQEPRRQRSQRCRFRILPDLH